MIKKEERLRGYTKKQFLKLTGEQLNKVMEKSFVLNEMFIFIRWLKEERLTLEDLKQVQK